MSVDPDLAETDQPYAYAGDDPVNESDPSGMCVDPLGDETIGGISDDSGGGYGYDFCWPLGQESVVGSPDTVMGYFEGHLQQVFPFSTGGCEMVQVSADCPLVFGAYTAPVQVIGETATSFEFMALQGHPDPAGSTVMFSVGEQDCEVYLEQQANAVGSSWLMTDTYPYLGKILWSFQAQNLSHQLGGDYMSPFQWAKPLIQAGNEVDSLSPVVTPAVHVARALWNSAPSLAKRAVTDVVEPPADAVRDVLTWVTGG
jgi:hypothetical protein